MKLLSLEDMLSAAKDAEVPGVEDLVAQAEDVAEHIAAALARHLGVKSRNTEFWDGKLYTTFLATHPGQVCPAAIDSGDPSGEWEADGNSDSDEEGAPMAMGG